MIKRFLVISAGVALLGACGGQEVHAPAPIGNLVRPGAAPWLTVAGGTDKLEVRGLDHKVILEPSPDLSTAVQSQLGMQLQADYFQDLVVTCTSLTTAMRVDEDKAPGSVAMNLGLHCAVWSRGLDTNHDYKAEVSTAVASGAGDEAYAQALPKLLADGSSDIAGQLRGDLQKLRHSAH
jgi:hypothetical protein